MADCIIFFVKYPTPGKVKTRLAKHSSPKLTAEFYRSFVQEKLAELAAGTKVDILIFFAPANKSDEMSDWLGDTHAFFIQQGNDLGERMKRAFLTAFEKGYDRAILVGSDIPSFSSGVAKDALSEITPTQAAIGPASDGGYYLIGFHKDGMAPAIFDNMSWSTPVVYEQTIHRLREAGLSHHSVPQLRDLDTLEDLQFHIDAGAFSHMSLAKAKQILG